MTTTNDEETILKAVEDPVAAKILAEIWRQIEGEPLMAARMVRAFKAAHQVIDETLVELPVKWKALEAELDRADLRRASFLQDLREFRTGTAGEVAAAVKDLGELEKFFAKIDDDAFLNKANRILELCERMAKAKRDGTLEFLKKMLTP